MAWNHVTTFSEDWQNFKNLPFFNNYEYERWICCAFPPLRWWVCLCCSVIVYSLSLHVFHYLSMFLSKTYPKLSKMDQLEWRLRLNSNLNSVVYCYGAVKAFFLNDDLLNDTYAGFLRSNCVVAQDTLSLSLGYFVVDGYFVLKYWSSVGGWGNFFHHFVAVSTMVLTQIFKNGYIYVLMFGLTELSTPFVNQRWYFSKCGQSDSLGYKLNGFFMWLAFLLIRIPLVFLYPFILINYHYYELTQRATKWALTVILSAYFIISTLNIYWFYLITKGLHRAVFGKPKSKKE